MTMVCADVQQQLTEILDPLRIENEALSAHLATCSACKEFQQQLVSWRSLAARLEPPALPSAFAHILRQRLDALAAPAQPIR